MTTRLRRYEQSHDFTRIRDFLTGTYEAFEKPLNWRIERWNYARFFTAPYLCKDEEITPEKSRRAIELWEGCIGVWDDDSDGIVGVVNTEHPWLGDAFIQRHPDHPHLLEVMLDFAEARLVDPESRSLRLFVYEHDEDLLSLVRERGYGRSDGVSDYDQEFIIGTIPEPNLPHGYTITSMAERNDLEGRGRAFGLGFNHPEPVHWAPVHVYEELQRAPDYRADLDLYAVDRNGEIASFCIVWYDAVNRISSLEPVGTIPHHRRKGLAREVILEGLRRASASGAKKAVVGGGNEFYRSIGFEKTTTCHGWVKRF